MKLFLSYLKERRGGIAVFLFFCVIFALSFYLYRLPMGAVLYPALLCALAGAILLSVDFIRVKRRHEMLSALKCHSSALLSSLSLPGPGGVTDEDYQDLIRALEEENAALESSSAARYQEMTDYYTVWVHQIKTPIASMKLSLQNEDTPLARKLRADLFRIEQYVTMVLAFLRLDSSSTDYVFREHEIDAVVRQSVSKFAAEFIDRKLRLEYAPLSGTVVTDDKWLSFVLEQLLSNALKYTREGAIRISMKAPKILSIEDTGIGIAPEDLPRIFEKGFTGYNGRRDKTSSGLGLYLCKRVCDNLGIKISVTSSSCGTAVSLDLSQYETKQE